MTSPDERTDLEVEVHEDGSATVYLPRGQNLDRISACVRCMVESDMVGGSDNWTIGDEPYARIYDGIAQTVVHERCLREGDHIVEQFPAR